MPAHTHAQGSRGPQNIKAPGLPGAAGVGCVLVGLVGLVGACGACRACGACPWEGWPPGSLCPRGVGPRGMVPWGHDPQGGFHRGPRGAPGPHSPQGPWAQGPIGPLLRQAQAQVPVDWPFEAQSCQQSNTKETKMKSIEKHLCFYCDVGLHQRVPRCGLLPPREPRANKGHHWSLLFPSSP